METGCDCCSLADQDLVWSRSDQVCRTCARVVQCHPMEDGPEWYDSANARADTLDRNSMFLGERGMAPLRPRYQERDRDAGLRQGLDIIGQRMSDMGYLEPMHQVTLRAKQFFTDFAKGRQASGRCIRESERPAAVCCALYFGFKAGVQANSRHPRGMKEVAQWCGVPIQHCNDMKKNFIAILKDMPYAEQLFHSVRANDLFVRALANIPLNIPQRQKVLNACEGIHDDILERNLLEGRAPETVCSAVLYKACQKIGIQATKRMIYQACSISNVTLNKVLSELDKENV